jgi:3-hydroxyacyl-[acyl-carrier-protein] dehydratase
LKSNLSAPLSIEEILKVLPHRQPFVLIDRVLELSIPNGPSRLGRKIKALKNLSYGEPFFAGHFPNRPVMPGVLIIEALAQAGAMACYRPEDPALDVAIGRIGEARIRRPVVPGDQLILSVEVVKDRGSTVLLKGEATVDGEPVTEVEILAYLTPRK